jgi:hypothetical protein
MNSPFIQGIRLTATRLNNVKSKDITDLEKLSDTLTKSIEEAILKHPDFGKKLLVNNIIELDRARDFVEPTVRRQLKIFEDAGLTEYDIKFYNAKEVALTLEDGLSKLLDLMVTYFPEAVKTLPDRVKLLLTPIIRHSLSDEEPPSTNEAPEKFKLNQHVFALLCHYLTSADNKVSEKALAEELNVQFSKKQKQLIGYYNLSIHRKGAGPGFNGVSQEQRDKNFQLVLDILRDRGIKDALERAQNDYSEFLSNCLKDVE